MLETTNMNFSEQTVLFHMEMQGFLSLTSSKNPHHLSGVIPGLSKNTILPRYVTVQRIFHRPSTILSISTRNSYANKSPPLFKQQEAPANSLINSPTVQPCCPSRGREGALEREAEAWITQRQVMKKNEKWVGEFFTNIIVIIALLTL